MSRYLVTGGAGFIGSHMVRALLKRDHQVVVLDDFSSGRRENLEQLKEDPGLEVHEADLRDPDAVAKAVAGCEFVFHLGAVPSVPRSVADPRTSMGVNVSGTLNLLEAVREAGGKRVVFASSSSVYGSNPELPKRESQRPLPLSPYAVSKLAGETLCQSYANCYDLETVCLRYFNVFGPRQDPNNPYAAVISKFFDLMMAGERPVIFGDGQQTRDFTYIENVVSANMLAMEVPGISGNAYNCACGGRVSLIELGAMINQLLGTDLEPRFEDPRPGDVPHSMADVSEFSAATGYRVLVSVEEGLARLRDTLRQEATA